MGNLNRLTKRELIDKIYGPFNEDGTLKWWKSDKRIADTYPVGYMRTFYNNLEKSKKEEFKYLNSLTKKKLIDIINTKH